MFIVAVQAIELIIQYGILNPTADRWDPVCQTQAHTYTIPYKLIFTVVMDLDRMKDVCWGEGTLPTTVVTNNVTSTRVELKKRNVYLKLYKYTLFRDNFPSLTCDITAVRTVEI